MPPVVDEKCLTKREKIILLKGSKIHANHPFWPWEKDPAEAELRGKEFKDDFQFSLSDFQASVLSGWQRPVVTPSEWRKSLYEVLDLVQDVTNDCSLVASLCAASARTAKATPRRGNIFSSVLYPFDTPSSSGKYCVKLQFNGCSRKVIIDDLLPVAKDGQYLHITARNYPSAIWPALIEKAYLKVMGGYDFPGSDSATDLWILTGWIPEQISLARNTIGPDDLWRRIAKTFTYGDVMITLGTPILSVLEEKVYGLAGGHDYAVIDLKEIEGKRMLLIKNPWSHASDHLRPNKSYRESGLETIPEDAHGKDLSSTERNMLMPGTQWMTLQDVFRLFETAYLSWNPDMFNYRRNAHFTLDLTIPNSPGAFEHNAQYLIRTVADCTVWLVLSRHLNAEQVTSRYIKHARTELGYISLYAFQAKSRRLLSDGSIKKTMYVGSQDVLLSLDVKANTPYVIVVSEQDLSRLCCTFTLSAFSTKTLDVFEPAPEPYLYTSSTKGAWTISTAGGNANSVHYHLNPQFSLEIPNASDIGLMLATSLKNIAVNLKLVWADGKRIQPGLLQRDIYASSGEYRRGSALMEVKNVPAGTYTLVCSTFETGLRATFNLKIFSTIPGCKLRSASATDVGMFRYRLPAAVFEHGNDRVLCPIGTPQTCKIRVMAQIFSGASSARSPFKISLEYGQGPNRQILGSSGEATSKAAALTLKDVVLQAKWCVPPTPGIWLVVERLGGSFVSQIETVDVEVLCNSQSLQGGPWGREADASTEQLRSELEDL